MAIKTEGYKDDEMALAKLNALDDARNKGLMTQAGEIAKLATTDAARASNVAAQIAELNKLKVEIPVFYTTKTGLELPMAPGTATQGMSPFGSGLQTQEQFRTQLERLGAGEAAARAQQAGLGTVTPELRLIDIGQGGQAVQVYVTVQGNVFTENELIDAVANGLYERNRAGTSSGLTNLGR